MLLASQNHFAVCKYIVQCVKVAARSLNMQCKSNQMYNENKRSIPSKIVSESTSKMFLCLFIYLLICFLGGGGGANTC